MYRLGCGVIVCWVVLLAGLSSSGQQPPTPPTTAPDSEPSLADAPGRDVVLRLCGECHEPAARISKEQRSEDGWAELVTDMEGRGMMATSDEMTIIMTYLTKHYGCPKPASSPCTGGTTPGAIARPAPHGKG